MYFHETDPFHSHVSPERRINTVRYFKALGSELPSHLVAPKLVLTPAARSQLPGGR